MAKKVVEKVYATASNIIVISCWGDDQKGGPKVVRSRVLATPSCAAEFTQPRAHYFTLKSNILTFGICCLVS